MTVRALNLSLYPLSQLRPLSLLLVIAIILIMGLLLTDRFLMQSEAHRTADQAERRLGAYMTSLQATIQQHQYLSRILAEDPRLVVPLRQAVHHPNLVGLDINHSHLLWQLNEAADSDEIFVMDHTGKTRWSSNYRSESSFVGQNYGFRPYFIDAMAGRQGFYYAVGATSGIPGLFFANPIYSDGEVLGVVVVKIDLAPLERSWLESGDQVWVTDRNGIIFLASDPAWHYRSLDAISQGVQNRLNTTLQYGPGPIEPLQRADTNLGTDWMAFKHTEQGPLLSLPSTILFYPWEMHWLVPLRQLRHRVWAQQLSIVLGYVLFAAGYLYYRERKRRTVAQLALSRLTLERESHQRAIIQNTDAGLLNLDARYQPIFINEKARHLFLLDQDSEAPMPSDLLSNWRPDQAGLGSVSAQGLRRDGSSFPILYTLNPIRVGDLDEYILTVQDITELTDAQIALQQANEALERRVEERTRDLQQAQQALAQNQKLAALGRMSAAIAHEINQPITALGNYAASSRLLLQHHQPEKVEANLSKIESLLERLSSLSRQLRIFSGKRNTGSEWVSLHNPIRYAQDLLRSRLDEQKIRCQLDLGDDVFVQANTMMLEQIVVNLLSNAIDALTDQSQPHILIQLKRTAEGEARLAIRDNGPGLTDEQQSKIFEPFYTTKPIGKGVGLGLAISYSLALDMGARLTVDGEPDQGCCFTLSFRHSQYQQPQSVKSEQSTV